MSSRKEKILKMCHIFSSLELGCILYLQIVHETIENMFSNTGSVENIQF